MEKRCTKCGETKPLEMFSPHAKTKDRKRSWCKPCCSKAYSQYAKSDDGGAVINQWNSSNADRKRQHFRDHYHRNVESHRERAAQYRSENPEKVKVSQATSKARNITSVYARNRARTDQQRLATPKWADVEKIATIYKVSAVLRNAGRAVCVDHIIPLISDVVCGLHVHNNLQVISTSENVRKGNRYWPNMPEGVSK